MTADNSSRLAINVLLGCALSMIVIILSDGVIVAAQQHDFANDRGSAVKPGLCPSPEEVDSQDLTSNCEDDGSCHGTKKCCKANTGAMLCLKAGSTDGCKVRGKVLQKGDSVMMDCYNCTCLDGSTLMCPSYNCSGAHKDTVPSKTGSCPKMVDPGECFAHKPCQQDSECSGDQKCCDVQCGIPICIAELQVPVIGLGCTVGDEHYSSGQKSNISDSQLNCYNCLCKSDGKWHCRKHLCRTKLRVTTGGMPGRASAVYLNGMSLLLLPLILSILYLY